MLCELLRVHSASSFSDSEEIRFTLDFIGADGDVHENVEYSHFPADTDSPFSAALTTWLSENQDQVTPYSVPSVSESPDVLPPSLPGLLDSPTAAPQMTLYALKRAFILGANIYDFDSWVKTAANGITSPSARAIALLDYSTLKPESPISRDLPFFSKACLAAAGMTESNFEHLWALALKSLK